MNISCILKLESPSSCATPRDCLWSSNSLLFAFSFQNNQIQGRQLNAVTMHASGKYFARSVHKNFHFLFKAVQWLLTMLHKLGSPCSWYVQKKIFYRNKKINHCKKMKFYINDFFSKCN